MSDPLGNFSRSIEDILVYLDTAFGTAWREVNEERNHQYPGLFLKQLVNIPCRLREYRQALEPD